MHAILVSVGTDGDIFPYVGLGAVLLTRGHQVTLVASETYEWLARNQGLGFQALVTVQENQELFDNPDFWNPRKSPQISARWGARLMERQYHLLRSLATPDAVLVSNPGVLASALVQERDGVAMASLILQPWLIPSSKAPPLIPGLTFLRYAPSPVWKLVWRALDGVGYVLVGRKLNRLRACLGMPPMRRLFQNWLSKELVIGMFPDWFGPPQSDWPGQLQLTGFPMFDGCAREVPEEVLRFCGNGAPPVAFTFGTGMPNPERFFLAALETCFALGVRGVLITKERARLPANLPPWAVYCEFAPFQKLFPLCSAVVNHGGIGTVAKALAAGVPQLVCPICFDQMDNGARLKRLGAGAWLKPGGCDAARMTAGLKKIMRPQTVGRAQALASRMKGVDAFGAAAELLEQLALRR